MRIPYSLLLALAAFALSLILTPLVRTLARRLGALDRPGPRRIHAEPVPTLGGLAFAAAVLAVVWGAYALPGPARLLEIRPIVGFTLATLPILALGVLDDLRGAPPWLKLAVQALASVILFQFGYGVPTITNPFDGPIETGALNLPLTVAWVLIVINAINLIDGLDGLAAGVVAIAAGTLWVVARTHADFYVMFLCAPLIGAMLGFLRYNFPPARIFMGDTGSHFLGLMLAAVSLLENRKGTATVTLLFPLVAMGVPIADGALAFVRRLLKGQPVFRADSEHVHHRLLRLGLSPRNAVLVLWYLSGYLGLLAVALSALPRSHAWLIVLLLALGLFFAFEVLEFIDRRLSERGPGSDPRDR
ncbi:MAG TPA: MraY family glycosyltransferase [Candidatus Limnocylindria bacterium]|nr:MraY family glycosyltransferase [Candidatus Limnocylindria bacterium]